MNSRGLDESPYGGDPLPGGVAQPYAWNTEHFARCMIKKLGIADVKAIVLAFTEPQVRRALKSRQWKVASSIAFNILKKASPKLASFLIKKAAGSLLPGGAIGILAFSAGQCALGEL